MNISESILPVVPFYKATYREKNTRMIIIWGVLMLSSVINLVKICNGGRSYDYWDVIWPISIIAYSYGIINNLISKTTFSIGKKQLTVTKLSLFRRKTKIYDLDRIEEPEMEQIIVNKYFLNKEPSGEYVVTFFYEDKTIELAAHMAKVHAKKLLDAIVAETET